MGDPIIKMEKFEEEEEEEEMNPQVNMVVEAKGKEDDGDDGKSSNDNLVMDKPTASKNPVKRKKTEKSGTITVKKKRASETNVISSDKKLKNVVHGQEGNEKESSGNDSLWSNADEEVLLNGMLILMKTGAKPSLDELFKYVKDSLPVGVGKSQFLNKMGELEHKYESIEKEGYLQVTCDHDLYRHQLSRLVWGGGIDLKENNGSGMVDSAAPKNGEGSSRGNGKGSKNVDSHRQLVKEPVDEQQSPQLPSFYNEIMESALKNSVVPPGLKGYLEKKAVRIVGCPRFMYLQQQWKELQLAEARVFLERIRLTKDVVKMVFYDGR